MDNLDYYATRINAKHLSVGMSSQQARSSHVPGRDPSRSDFTMRFHALEMYGVTDVSMFMLPTTETWMPWLRKWKNNAAGCPRGGTLSKWGNVTCY
jgi:hypothetical protein